MDLRDLVYKKYEENYKNNDYIKNRINNELAYLEKSGRISEIETLLDINNIVQNHKLIISEGSLLSLYLLDLTYINPLPAHYLSHDNEVIFDNSKNIGLDLEKKDDFIRDGFDIDEGYVVYNEKPFVIATSIDEIYKNDVVDLLEKKFDLSHSTINYSKTYVFNEATNDKLDVVKFGNTRITFLKHEIAIRTDRNWYNSDQAGKLKKLALSKELLENWVKNDRLANKGSNVEGIDLVSKINTFDDLVYLFGRNHSKLPLRSEEISSEGINHMYPTNRHDLYRILKGNGYTKENAATIARGVSFKEDYDFSDLEDDIKQYISAIDYQWTKDAIINYIISEFLNRK